MQQTYNSIIWQALNDNLGVVSSQQLHNLQLNIDRQQHPMLVVACPSRSGATLLGHYLMGILNLKWQPLTAHYFNNENEIYLPALLEANNQRSMSVLHMRATWANNYWLQLFKAQVVVSIRNIFATVVSLARYVRLSKTHVNYFSGYASASMMWFDGNQDDLQDSELVDMIVQLYVPWIIHFYVSWYQVSEREEIEVVWIDFDDLKQKPINCINKIIHHYSILAPTIQDSWQNIINSCQQLDFDSIRKGDTPTREYWEKLLTKQHRQTIKQYTKFYPRVDFTALGINDT